MGETEPSTTEGETLGLWHYLVPAGAALAPHTHPGDQIARIVRGTLTYEVVSGEARVVPRGWLDRDGRERPGHLTLEPGDAVIEPAAWSTWQQCRTRPVEIVAATLFETRRTIVADGAGGTARVGSARGESRSLASPSPPSPSPGTALPSLSS